MKTVFFVLSTCLCLVAAQNSDLVQLAQQLGATTLLSFLKTAGLEVLLKDGGPFTVFAPSNAAFDALPADVKAALGKNKDLLKQVLEFHVIDGRQYSSYATNDLLVQTEAQGLDIRVNTYQSHSVITVDGAKVTLRDQNATNGVIHVIDKVMYPLPTARIPAIVAGMPSRSTLLYAVAQGKLVDALNGTGPLTVFAPNNQGFDKLPTGKLSDLLSNTTALQDLLEYHVVSGTYYSQGLVSGPVTMLNGETVSVTVGSGSVTVNNATVVMADIPTTNGVIHIIDNVLIPKK